MPRRLAEILSRGVVLRRRLPARFGRLRVFVTPDSELRLWRFDLEKAEPTLFRWVEEHVRPGDVVWDVGANVGLFTMAAATRATSVVAFEPDPSLAALLSRNAALVSGVAVEQIAVSDREGHGRLCISRRGRAANHLDDVPTTATQAGGRRRVETVRLSTLDVLARARHAPSLLKIDVEGAEAAVLRGATSLLRDVRPRILCEVWRDNADEVTATLRAAGYALFDADDGHAIDRAAWATLAVPR